MKNLLILCLLLFSIQGFSQVIPVLSCKVPDLTTPFGQNLSKGTEVFVLSDSTKHTAILPVVSTETMTTAASSFISSVTKIIGVLPITATGNGKVTISINPATTTTAGSLSAVDKVRVDSIPLLERKSNKVTSLSSESTNTQYPSAKAVWDQLATKEATITAGTTGQYWRGDKTWQTLPAGTGTVTSVTGGTGITGGTITASGTLAIDTNIVAKNTTVASMYQPKGNYQAALSGTGFVKISGTTISYDNSTYVTGAPWTSAGYLTSVPDLYLRNDGNDTSSGSVTATNFILSSDKRLKFNIQNLNRDDFYRIAKIDFCKFFMHKDSTELRFGVVADQVLKVAPEFVIVPTDSKEMKTVKYIDLLIAKCAQLEQVIRDQDRRIEKLENKNKWKVRQMIIQ